MRYLLKTTEGPWEEVNMFVYDHRKIAVIERGTMQIDANSPIRQSGTVEVPRYDPDTYILVHDDNTVNFHGDIKLSELGRLARILGVSTPAGTFPEFFKTPETITFRKPNAKKIMLHDLKRGINYQQV